jgi:hypothetical protein
MAAMEQIGAFDDIEHQAGAWSLVLDPERTVALYATFSNINIRADRAAILGELGRIARDDFHGSVTRNMTAILYTALSTGRRRRRASCKACHTRCADAGISRCATPCVRSASITAFIAVGSEPTVPASPTPLTPRVLVGDGTRTVLIVTCGSRSACGMV